MMGLMEEVVGMRRGLRIAGATRAPQERLEAGRQAVGNRWKASDVSVD